MGNLTRLVLQQCLTRYVVYFFSRGGSLSKAKIPSAPSSMPVWLDDVTCEGTESLLTQCTHAGIGKGNCGHSEDVKIQCQPMQGFYWIFFNIEQNNC